MFFQRQNVIRSCERRELLAVFNASWGYVMLCNVVLKVGKILKNDILFKKANEFSKLKISCSKKLFGQMLMTVFAADGCLFCRGNRKKDQHTNDDSKNTNGIMELKQRWQQEQERTQLK